MSMAGSCILTVTLKEMQSSSSQPARMKVLNTLGSRSLTGPGKCQQDGSSRDISSYKSRTKHHNLTDKSYSSSKRNCPLRNCYIFNISDLDWTIQWSTWIHFSHQVLPPAASANVFPQAVLPCRPHSLEPQGLIHAALQLKNPELLTASPGATPPARSLPQLTHNKPCHPTFPCLPQANGKSRTMY